MHNKPVSMSAWRRPHASLRSVIFMALVAMAPAAAYADKHAATPPPSRVTDVSLADLNLSTPDGMRAADQRLRTMAQHICAGRADNAAQSQLQIVSCVDSTVAGALRNINTLQSSEIVRNSVTRAANVSLADLDLSTVEGSRVARERLEAMARRLCAELARSNDLTYRPNWAACVNNTTANALVQANVLAAQKATKIARRVAP